MNQKQDFIKETSAHPVPQASSVDEMERMEADLTRLQMDAEVKARERLDIMDMRRTWSRWLLGCIVGLFVFDASVIFLLGFHVISFEMDFLVPTFIAESLIKIIGLCYVVVRFLFNENSLYK